MHLKARICTNCVNTPFCIIVHGYYTCEHCGKMYGQFLDTNLTSFTQSFKNIQPPYSRRNRFHKKMLSALRCRGNYKINLDLLQFLQKQTTKTPEDLLSAMSKYKLKKLRRRPYMYITYYWIAIGHKLPIVSESSIQKLLYDFDNIFYAWRRLNFQKPDFPYAYLFRKLVITNQYCKPLCFLIRFVRRLACKKRRERYDDLYAKCVKNVIQYSK